MITAVDIDDICNEIQREFNPLKIILFGSYATGEATEDSDVDLLVVAETDLPPRRRYVAARTLLLHWPVAFDIIVKTPAEYARSRKALNHIVYFADKYGKVLYER